MGWSLYLVKLKTSSVVDHGLKPLSGKTNNYELGICSFSHDYLAIASLQEQQYIGRPSSLWQIIQIPS
jgi:hypothetical protein